MPSFPYIGSHAEYLGGKPVYSVRKTPSIVGLLTEVFRRSSGVLRSLEPDHPFCAWGTDASKVVGDGSAAGVGVDLFGPDSIHRRVLSMKATLVGLGVSLNTNTFIHVIDAQLEHLYGFPIYYDDCYDAFVEDYNGQRFNVKRKAIRREVHTYIKPSAMVPLVNNRPDIFSFFQIKDVNFFRWDLCLLEMFCLQHARERLEKGMAPEWHVDVKERIVSMGK